jgi:rubrerythrin
LNKHRDENNVKSQLAFILSTRKNDYGKELFSSDDIYKDPVIKQMAYLYYAKIGFKENYEGILKILDSIEDQSQEFLTLAFNLAQYSNGEVIKLFNDKTIVDKLNNPNLKTIDNQLKNSFISLNLTENIYEKSYLFERIKNAQHQK